MSKIFGGIILFLLYFFSFSQVIWSWELDLVENEIKIITREEWWADEWFRFLDSDEWKEIIKKWKDTPKKELTNFQKQNAIINAQKVKVANTYLTNNYYNLFNIDKIIDKENWHKLAWPIAYSKNKSAIVIHHTDSDISEWVDNYDLMKKIYKYHAITRWWWDIWYNYLIWTNWEIFEWRAWWDFAVWAHDKWNNQSTIWISLIWNFSGKKAWVKQMESLEKLTRFLVNKYNIDLKKKNPFFKWCVWNSKKCIDKPLETEYKYPIIGHRDAWHTACPWDKLYEQMELMNKKIGVWLAINDEIVLDKLEKKLELLDHKSLISTILKIEVLLDNKKTQNRDILNGIKNIILKIEKERNILKFYDKSKESFDDNNKIKVKLSYPHYNNISFKIDKNLSLNLKRSTEEYILDFEKKIKSNTVDTSLDFVYKNNKLFINWKMLIDFKKNKFLRIRVPDWEIIEVTSWDRKPSWDKTWKFNDNKFKWEIVLYSKDNMLVVVNDIILNDYLKWLWEVSNWTNSEKIRTIIVLARTYARWYMTKARKFSWEWFDASDDPNVFQKYLWFWLEQRSPKINKIVEETKDLVVTYEWDLIKPWYFSSSDWETTSFIDYCENAKWIPDCSHPEKFPFLVWVKDLWWLWKNKAWHWVWVPWTWIQYLSEREWSYYSIIKYFLDWVKIEKIYE